MKGINKGRRFLHKLFFNEQECRDHHENRTSYIIRIPVILYSEKAMAPHSSALAWKIPWMEEPGRLQSMGSQRGGHD